MAYLSAQLTGNIFVTMVIPQYIIKLGKDDPNKLDLATLSIDRAICLLTRNIAVTESIALSKCIRV